MAAEEAYQLLVIKDDNFHSDVSKGLDSKGKMLGYAFELVFFACYQLVAIRRLLEEIKERQ